MAMDNFVHFKNRYIIDVYFAIFHYSIRPKIFKSSWVKKCTLGAKIEEKGPMVKETLHTNAGICVWKRMLLRIYMIVYWAAIFI